MIANYLKSKDFFNFKNFNSNTNNILNMNSTLIINKYKEIINEKNLEIQKLNNDPFNGKLITGENKIIEELLREYLQMNKIPGMNLKNKIEDDLNFIDSDVINPLGISIPNKTKRSSFFGK